MRRRLPLLLLLVLLLALGLWFWNRSTPTTTAASTQQTAAENKDKERRKASYTWREVLQRSAQEGDFEADPEGTLSLDGQVVDEDGKGITGATVVLSSNPAREVISKENGWFSFDKLVARSYFLQAYQQDFSGEQWAELRADSTPVTIVLKRGSVLRVMVVDGSSQSPIEGASVSYGWRQKRSETTDAQGIAMLRGLRGPRELLDVRADGYGPQSSVALASGQADTVDEHTVTLLPGALVSGRVLSPAGEPVAGAKVSAQPSSGGGGFFRMFADDDSIVSDAEGRWSIPALSAGTYRFRARHDTFGPGISSPTTLDGQTPNNNIDIVLTEGAVLTGKVLQNDGSPVSGALVRVSSRGMGPGGARRSAFSKEDGSFQVGGLAQGPLTVVARFESSTSPTTEADLTGKQTETVELRLSQNGTIEGIVVDSKGQPIAEASVMAIPQGGPRAFLRLAGGPPRASSDADGHFVLDGLPEDGAYTLSASLDAGDMQFRGFNNRQGTEAKTGARDIKLIIEDRASIQGKVQLASGEIPGKFTVSLQGGSTVTINRGAEFVIQNVTPGVALLEVSGPGFLNKNLEPIEIAPGESKDVGVIVVDPGRSLRGVVVDAQNQPVSGASINAGKSLAGNGLRFGSFGEAIKTGISGNDGSFVIAGLPESFAVVADHPDKGRSQVQMVPTGSSEAKVSLKLAPTGALEGVVLYKGSPTRADIEVRLIGSSAVGFFVNADEEGHYRFDKLSPGKYQVTAARRGDGPARGGEKTLEVNVGTDNVTTLNIEIPTGITVAIEVTEGDAPANNVFVWLILGRVQPKTSVELQTLVDSMPADASKRIYLPDNPQMAFRREFPDVLPGQYTFCGHSVDKLQPFRDDAPAVPVVCTTLTVAASPERQSASLAMP